MGVGVSGSPGPGTGGMPPPPPKSTAGNATKGNEKPKAAAASPRSPKPTAVAQKPITSQPKAASKKTPLILVGGIGALLVIAIVVVAVILMRSGSEEQPSVAETETPVIETPSQPEPLAEQPEETANTEDPPSTQTEPATEQPPVSVAPPQIASFLAEPSTINQGESAKLRWSSTNSSYVQINPGLSRGRNIGEHTVTPSQTTKYTLVARGLGGRVQREVTVTVVPRQQPQQPSSTKPNGWTLDALVRALESGEDVVKMDNLMVRVGLNGVSFAVTPEAQRAILAAGERGNRPQDAVVRLLDLARQGGRR